MRQQQALQHGPGCGARRKDSPPNLAFDHLCSPTNARRLDLSRPHEESYRRHLHCPSRLGRLALAASCLSLPAGASRVHSRRSSRKLSGALQPPHPSSLHRLLHTCYTVRSTPSSSSPPGSSRLARPLEPCAEPCTTHSVTPTGLRAEHGNPNTATVESQGRSTAIDSSNPIPTHQDPAIHTPLPSVFILFRRPKAQFPTTL